MTFSFQGSKEPLTVKDLINLTLARLDKEINTPIPLLKRDEWQKERTAKAKEIVTTLQSQLLSVSKLQKRKIKDVGKKMYIDVKQKIALAVETDRENMTLRQRISELDERAVAREKNRADAAERKVQEQIVRGDREENRANDAENRLSPDFSDASPCLLMRQPCGPRYFLLERTPTMILRFVGRDP
jgi:hypothetical protein